MLIAAQKGQWILYSINGKFKWYLHLKDALNRGEFCKTKFLHGVQHELHRSPSATGNLFSDEQCLHLFLRPELCLILTGGYSSSILKTAQQACFSVHALDKACLLLWKPVLTWSIFCTLKVVSFKFCKSGHHIKIISTQGDKVEKVSFIQNHSHLWSFKSVPFVKKHNGLCYR